MYLLDKEDAIKVVLKAWDTKGRGEFMKAEFRLNLRGTGIQATSAEADALFDSWDECARRGCHPSCHRYPLCVPVPVRPRFAVLR
jgi:hypothetical protein